MKKRPERQKERRETCASAEPQVYQKEKIFLSHSRKEKNGKGLKIREGTCLTRAQTAESQGERRRFTSRLPRKMTAPRSKGYSKKFRLSKKDCPTRREGADGKPGARFESAQNTPHRVVSKNPVLRTK